MSKLALIYLSQTIHLDILKYTDAWFRLRNAGIVKIPLSFAIAMVVSLLLLGVLTVDRSLPVYEGELEAPGLRQQMEIYRDSFGI